MLPERYNAGNLERVCRNPSLLLREGRRFVGVATKPLANYYYNQKYGSGLDVVAEDWDNLILLDACRYDYFAEQNQIDGELERVVSRGGNSWGFLEANFGGRKLHDTVYVTTNPYADQLSEDVFHYKRQLLSDKWNDDIGTVHPSDVTSVAREVHENYPNKRLIVHYMQPHTPYLGETAERIRERVNLVGQSTGDRYERSGKHTFAAVWHGEISWDELRRGYSETLDIALKHVETLVESVNGKTVISADHGELLGERNIRLGPRQLGHPDDIFTEQHRIVPWHVVSSESRRDVESEPPVDSELVNEEKREEQLRALGYKAD